MRITDPAEVKVLYIRWLRGYLERGGKPTDYFDLPFARSGLQFSYTDGVVKGYADLLPGEAVRYVIAGPGASVDCAGSSCPTVYFLDDHRLSDSLNPFVPVYSDPEFEPLLSDDHRIQRDLARLTLQDTLLTASRNGELSHLRAVALPPEIRKPVVESVSSAATDREPGGERSGHPQKPGSSRSRRRD